MARYLFWPRVDNWMELVVPTTEVLRVHRISTTLARDRRIERTLYALDWLEQAPLRRQATAELNKGESRNALARAMSPIASVVCATARPNCSNTALLTLVSAAIVLWNTVYLGQARTNCEGRAGCAACPHHATRVAAHQSHERLSLGRNPR